MCCVTIWRTKTDGPSLHRHHCHSAILSITGTDEWQNEFIMFMKNMSMMGGLLMFLAEKRTAPLIRSSAPRTAYGIKKNQ